MEENDRESYLIQLEPVVVAEEVPVLWSNRARLVAGDITPLLSICVPFFKFDTTKLLARLLFQARPVLNEVEIFLADDASGDLPHDAALRELATNADTPVTIAVFPHNLGRARIRHYLTGEARGSYVLFMDCDMFPDSNDFIARYLEAASQGVDDLVVGGCSYAQIGRVPADHLLYYHYSDATQCMSVDGRRKSPFRYVFTNNMMIRKVLLAQLSFDTGYVGWGYEDTDLAISVGRAGARIIHIDNTATHLGLIDDSALIRKYRNSVANFLRLVQKFPREATSLPIFRAATMLSRIPLPYRLLSAIAERLARATALPLRLRCMFLQCLKLFLYSEAMHRQTAR